MHKSRLLELIEIDHHFGTVLGYLGFIMCMARSNTYIIVYPSNIFGTCYIHFCSPTGNDINIPPTFLTEYLVNAIINAEPTSCSDSKIEND